MEQKVVVTGMGAVSSVGNDVPSTWSALLAGHSGVAAIEEEWVAPLRCRIAGYVKNLDLNPYLDLKAQKRMDPFCHYAVVAADEAMKDAGLDASALDPYRAGVLVSTGIGGMQSLIAQFSTVQEKGLTRLSPLTIPMMICDMASGLLSIRYNFRGPNFAIVSACASGLHSIGEAMWIIRRGDADVMLAGSAECVQVHWGQAGFANMRALSERNDAPTEASRPFDRDRDGFVPSEGAGVLVLESEEHARKRGARILAEVAGYGASADAHHITAPREDGECSARAISNAVRSAGIPVEAISYINAHGTSTSMNDVIETRAIKIALGEHAKKLAVSSTKSMTGHALGASGAIEATVCINAILKGAVPPTINLQNPDPECDLDYVPNTARELKVDAALDLSFGFGGHNAALLLKRYS